MPAYSICPPSGIRAPYEPEGVHHTGSLAGSCIGYEKMVAKRALIARSDSPRRSQEDSEMEAALTRNQASSKPVGLVARCFFRDINARGAAEHLAMSILVLQSWNSKDACHILLAGA